MGYDWWPPGLDLLTGVEPHEVCQVLAAGRKLALDATAHGLRVIAICGRTAAGRPLAVLVRTVGDLDQQILSARDMTPNELALFHTWEARHHD